jgi:N-methylhydantoinase A
LHKAALGEYPPGQPRPVAEARIGERQVYLNGQHVATPVYARDLLQPCNVIDGPAIIEQLDTTSLLLPGQRGTVDRFLNLLVEDGVPA